MYTFFNFLNFSISVPADTRIIRSCGWDESNYKGKCYQRGGFGGRQEVCSCTRDFCNGVSSQFLPKVFYLISFAYLNIMLFY